jgi:hypothetical protein
MVTNETPLSTMPCLSPSSPLTPERARRIRQAIADYDRFISKEEARDASLRPANMQKLLEEYKDCRARLESLLS